MASSAAVLVVVAAAGTQIARFARHANQAGAANKGSEERAIPVQVVPASLADVPVTQTALGTVVSRQSVVVRARVSGQLARVLFEEGQTVQEGQVLAEIDPRPFQVQLTQIEGQAARDQALLDNALLDQKRYHQLSKSGLISGQQADSQDSLVRQYEGAVHSDKGLLASASLELSFTRVVSPVTGRIGLRQVDAGNNVTPGDPSGIAVVNVVNPITVVFTLPEDAVPAVVHAIHEADHAGRSLDVEAWDRGFARLLTHGRLASMDNQIDPSTGTVKLKAEFANDDGVLFVNQFVNVRLVLEQRRGATVIPSVAVQRGVSGPFVYVAVTENKASLRSVVTGPADGAGIVVEHGVAPGDLVVTSGTDQLRDGSRIALAKTRPQREEHASSETPRAGVQATP